MVEFLLMMETPSWLEKLPFCKSPWDEKCRDKNTVGCVILPKVLKNIGIVNFPITLALRTLPSEKFSKKFLIYYPAKLVGVLLYALYSSDFGPIT